jgi:hypothetical protein
VNCSDDISIKFNDLLVNFQKHFIKDNVDGQSTDEIVFFENNKEIYTKYLPFLIGLYGMSLVLGYFISKVIIHLNIDTNFKIFRFRNEWYYIFNGKLLRFKKVSSNDSRIGINVKHTYLDVLVRTNMDTPTLYSGFLADYELNFENISKIERLHLLKAVRRDVDDNGNRINLKPIPGNIFTILGENIININCTYILFNSSELKRRKFERLVKPVVILQLISFLFLAIMFVTVVIMKTNVTSLDFINVVISKSLWYRLIFVFFLNVIIGFITPFDINRNELEFKFIGWHAIFLKIIFSVLLFSILYFNRY